MFELNLGRSPRYCDGYNRRSFLKIGVAGMAGVGLPELLRARERLAEGAITAEQLKEVDTSGVAPGDYYKDVVMAKGERTFRSNKDPKP